MLRVKSVDISMVSMYAWGESTRQGGDPDPAIHFSCFHLAVARMLMPLFKTNQSLTALRTKHLSPTGLSRIIQLFSAYCSVPPKVLLKGGCLLLVWNTGLTVGFLLFRAQKQLLWGK